jgi:hypothetical protein
VVLPARGGNRIGQLLEAMQIIGILRRSSSRLRLVVLQRVAGACCCLLWRLFGAFRLLLLLRRVRLFAAEHALT